MHWVYLREVPSRPRNTRVSRHTSARENAVPLPGERGSLDDFLAGFPTASREDAVEALA